MLKVIFQILLIVSLCSLTTTRGCPSPCTCKWKGGKQTVECGGEKLLSLPEGMDPGTQVLNFSYNGLTVLQNERFQSMELTNLQKIYLSHNELIRIHDRAFRGLSNLVELDLSYNKLTSVPTETFQDYSSLMRLSLSNNPVRELKASAFKYLSYLTTLDLNDCQIIVIEDGTFLGMDNLEWLRLDGNQIRTIRGAKILPETLNGIGLQGNRWICDCKLIDIFGWIKTYNIPQTEDPKCFGPKKHQGQAIKSLQIDELACLPEISPTTIYLEIAEGRNITLTCKITAVPEASISWWFQGQVLQNDTIIAPNLHLYYYVEEGVDEKRSELFIYNANADDNGTFACVAENAAGRTQANYTVRVIVKEEPVVEEVSFPNEMIFLFIIVSAIVLCLIIVICCCVIMCKCRKRRRRRNENDPDGKQQTTKNGKQKKKSKRNKKEVSFQLPNSQKCVAITNDLNNSLVCSKINGNLTITDNNQQEMLLYLGNNAQNISISDMSSLQGHCGSPQDIRNPDLINDAESLRQRTEHQLMQKHHHDGVVDEAAKSHVDNENNFSSVVQQQQQQLRAIPSRFSNLSSLPRNINMRDMYQVDVHLNPGCFIDANGYPIEYIPIINQSQLSQVNYNSNNGYATLPHNRNKSSSGSAPLVRLSNEAEFITRTSQTFQTYNSPDVRYTAEGYPCIVDSLDTQNFPSPPEGYKTDAITSSSLPTTISIVNSQNFLQQHPQQFNSSTSSSSAVAVVPKWPSCLPAPGYPTAQQNLSIEPTTTTSATTKNVRFQLSPLQKQQQSNLTSKKCVGAQTSSSDLCENNVIHEVEEEDDDEDDENMNECERQRTRSGNVVVDETGNHTKCRQLKGRPLADSPDEGYVGDSQESSDM